MHVTLTGTHRQSPHFRCEECSCILGAQVDEGLRLSRRSFVKGGVRRVGIKLQFTRPSCHPCNSAAFHPVPQGPSPCLAVNDLRRASGENLRKQSSRKPAWRTSSQRPGARGRDPASPRGASSAAAGPSQPQVRPRSVIPGGSLLTLLRLPSRLRPRWRRTAVRTPEVITVFPAGSSWPALAPPCVDLGNCSWAERRSCAAGEAA